MLRLSDIPRYEMLAEHAKRYPTMDPVASEAFIVLLHTGNRMSRRAEQFLAGHGTTPARFVTLALLNREPDRPMSATELANRTCVTKQTITSLLDGLVADGFIERIAMEGDRRVTLVRLLPAGIEFLNRIMPHTFEAHKAVMSALTADEQRQLALLLRKVWPSLEE